MSRAFRRHFESISKASATQLAKQSCRYPCQRPHAMTSDQAAFLAQKDQPGGKKTMKSYLWSICAAAYDAEHNG